jgi:hypothetical protein
MRWKKDAPAHRRDASPGTERERWDAGVKSAPASDAIEPDCPRRADRPGAWFTPERAQLYSLALVIAFAGSIASIFVQLKGGYTKDGLPFGMDFASFWAASRLIWAGMATYAYVPDVHKLAEMAVMPPSQYEAFFYPPPYLLFCAPLAALPFFWSMAAFMGATASAYALAVSRAAASAWVAIAAVFSPAVLVNLITGQNGMLTAAFVGGGLTLMDRRPRLAGLVLGLMVIKPHLALAVPIALVLSRRWTVLGFAALSAFSLMALATGCFGWEVWRGFLANMSYGRRVLEDGLVPFSLFQSAFALARMLGGHGFAAYALQGISAGAALAVLIWAQRRRVSPALERSLIVLASLLVTPYVLHYDLVVLVFPSVWLLTEWVDRGFPRWGKLVLLALYLLPIAIFVFPGGHFGLLGMIALLAYLGRGVRGTSHAGPGEMPEHAPA